MAYTPSKETIRLTSSYLVATASVQFDSSAKMKVTYKDGTTFDGTFTEWKADPAQRKRLFDLKTVVVGRKAKKVQAFITPANEEEKALVSYLTEGLTLGKFPKGNSQQVGRDHVTAMNRLWTRVFPDSESYKLGLVDRDDSKKEPVETNVPGN